VAQPPLQSDRLKKENRTEESKIPTSRSVTITGHKFTLE
jgi:hypothetical protein